MLGLHQKEVDAIYAAADVMYGIGTVHTEVLKVKGLAHDEEVATEGVALREFAVAAALHDKFVGGRTTEITFTVGLPRHTEQVALTHFIAQKAYRQERIALYQHIGITATETRPITVAHIAGNNVECRAAGCSQR